MAVKVKSAMALYLKIYVSRSTICMCGKFHSFMNKCTNFLIVPLYIAHSFNGGIQPHASSIDNI